MKTERFEMRMDEEILAKIDDWRREQDDVPSRAEAIRRLVESSLNSRRAEVPKPDPYAAMTLFMLADVVDHLKAGPGIDTNLLRESLTGGHYWALGWELPGVIHSHADKRENVSEVVDILDMWTFLESGFKGLSKAEKEKVAAAIDRSAVVFPGFDGNNESEQYAIARHLIDVMGRWSNFKGRELNSHFPAIDGYRRMLSVFLPIRATLTGVKMNADQITQVIKARR